MTWAKATCDDMTLAIAQSRSGNVKLGDAATTHVAQVSCPPSCVFKDGGGCYAETGRQGKFVTRRLNEAAEGATALDAALAEAEAIDRMDVAPGRPMRLHTVGDCATDEAARIVAAASARYRSRGGGPVWTYTHAWRTVDRASWGDVSVLASCETIEDIRAARERGYATAIVVDEFPGRERYYLMPGEPGRSEAVIPCPAQTSHRTCSDCRLCMNDDARLQQHHTIGFAIHGIPATKRAARMALDAPDDPDRRLSSEERIRIIRDRYLRVEGREPTTREVCDLIDLNESSAWQWLRYLRGDAPHPAEERRARDARRKLRVLT